MLLLLAPLSLFAFGPAAQRRAAEAALRLSPAALRSVLLSHRTDLDRGLAEALNEFAGASEEALVAALEREASLPEPLAEERAPFSRVALHFGRAAGIVLLLNDPVSPGSDPRLTSVRADYDRYVDRKLPLLVLSFDGWDTPSMEGDLKAYFRARRVSSARYREALLTCYYPGGRRASSDTFDDRSNAFGVAQVALSHAASDAAKAWRRMWAAMDGDLAATPFGGSARAPSAGGAP
jgi:hypothetical protein